MKKMTAAALAATMTLSLGMAPAADAASNTMTKVQGRTACNMTFDRPSDISLTNGLKDPKKVKDQLFNSEENFKVAEFTEASSVLGQAFGSSDAETVNDANNLAALRACAAGENYKSQPLSESDKAGIIAGTVILALLAIGGAVAPFVGPMIQQFLP